MKAIRINSKLPKSIQNNVSQNTEVTPFKKETIDYKPIKRGCIVSFEKLIHKLKEN